MTMTWRKRWAWGLMSGGFGAALLFGLAVLVEGSAPSGREWVIYFWPVTGVVLGVVGLRGSRRLYREAPPIPPAAWTVSLTDLLMGAFFAGVCSSIVAASGDDFRRLVPVMGVIGLVLYIHGALAASLRGIFDSKRRPLFVIAHILLTLGLLGWMTLGLAFIIVTFLFRDPPNFDDGLRVVRDVLFDRDRGELLLMMRLCVYALPLGYVLMRIVDRLSVRDASIEE